MKHFILIILLMASGGRALAQDRCDKDLSVLNAYLQLHHFNCIEFSLSEAIEGISINIYVDSVRCYIDGVGGPFYIPISKEKQKEIVEFLNFIYEKRGVLISECIPEMLVDPRRRNYFIGFWGVDFFNQENMWAFHNHQMLNIVSKGYLFSPSKPLIFAYNWMIEVYNSITVSERLKPMEYHFQKIRSKFKINDTFKYP